MKERPDVLVGKTKKGRTDCGTIYLTLNELDKKLFEIKVELGKSGNCIKSLLHIIGVLYSIILQSDMADDEVKAVIKKHFLGVSCGNPFLYKSENYRSCIDWVSRQILEELDEQKD